MDIGSASTRQALIHAPDDAAAWHDLGIQRSRGSSPELAAVAFGRQAALSPSDAVARVNRSNMLQRLRRDDEARRDLRRAVALAGSLASASESIAYQAWAGGRMREARIWYGHALAAEASEPRARLGACISELPVVYETANEIDEARRRYTQALSALDSSTTSVMDLARLADAVGTTQPFFLAYQAREDRALQSMYGRLVCRALAARHPALAETPKRREARRGERLRVGLVSGYFRRHSVWKMALSGWIKGLDRSRFSLFGYHTSLITDDVSARAESCLDGFIKGVLDRPTLARRIRDDQLDFIIYPEIGMDPVAAWLAALRLAPIQAMTWGHPTTSGYPTIDLFLSSDLMEPNHGFPPYTERLVSLPGLGCLYSPIDLTPAPLSRRDLGLEAADIGYLCAQSLYKYLPQDDDLLVHIADAVPRARFIFFSGPMPTVAATFTHRLSRHFAAAGHDPAYRLVMLPLLTESGFLGVVRHADVLLDSVGWSGFNSTLEVIANGVPVVTLPGNSLRSRHTSAILSGAGLDDMIASDRNDYTRKAIRFGLDSTHRRAEGERIRRMVPRLFDDDAPIRALETVIMESCGFSSG